MPTATRPVQADSSRVCAGQRQREINADADGTAVVNVGRSGRPQPAPRQIPPPLGRASACCLAHRGRNRVSNPLVPLTRLPPPGKDPP